MRDEDLWDESNNPRHYLAFISKDKAIGLEIVRANAPSRCPGYGYLLDISWGRNHYTAFALFFTFMIVTVRGERLKDVIDAIKLRKCTAIVEYRRGDFDEPAADKPIIRSIEITVKSIPEMIAAGEKSLDPA